MDETRFDGIDDSNARLGSRSSKTETEYEAHDQKEKTLENQAKELEKLKTLMQNKAS